MRPNPPRPLISNAGPPKPYRFCLVSFWNGFLLGILTGRLILCLFDTIFPP